MYKQQQQTMDGDKSVSAACLPVVVTIFCTNTPAFCRQLTGKPPRLDEEEPRSGAEPAATWRGIMGADAD